MNRRHFTLWLFALAQALGQESGSRRDVREFLGLGPAPDAAAAKKGDPLYGQNCSACHGVNARGAQGPSLVRSAVVLHDENDAEIGRVIREGRPQGGMPAFPNLSKGDIHNLSQYLKLQIELAANRGTYNKTYGDLRNKVTGDAKEGETFFLANCTQCHAATGDLARIGSQFRQAAQLQSRFLWPAQKGQAEATVTTASGETIRGTVHRMDDFEVSLTDSTGAYRWWPRDRVRVDTEDKLAGHRALLPKYSNADIHNLTAYLVTLK